MNLSSTWGGREIARVMREETATESPGLDEIDAENQGDGHGDGQGGGPRQNVVGGSPTRRAVEIEGGGEPELDQDRIEDEAGVLRGVWFELGIETDRPNRIQAASDARREKDQGIGLGEQESAFGARELRSFALTVIFACSRAPVNRFGVEIARRSRTAAFRKTRNCERACHFVSQALYSVA